jgi:hypothetical protein
MGCGEEYPAASGKTPGWEIIIKHHYIAYKHGEQIVMYQL